jgi:type IV secretory pathway VirB4 component
VRLRPRRPAPTPPAGLLGPDALEIIGPRTLRAGGTLCATFAVTGYPREVGPGWLEPLLTSPGPADVAVHVEPIPPQVAADRLRRQLARLESSQRLDADRGRLPDPEVEVAAADARDLAGRLARGEGRLFRVGVYATVCGADQAELDGEAARLRALLGSLLLDAHPATFRPVQGWVTTLPLGLDQLRLRRTFDTAALAAAFPFASAELPPADGGVLYGRNAHSPGLVVWDRFAQPNYNQVILARSGAGKSYLAKLEVLRWLYQGTEVWVVDPEDEYRRLAEAVGGAHLALGAGGVRLNPFDLGTGPDALTRRALFLHTLVAVLVGQPLDPQATAALDRGVIAAYHARGITADPRTHARPAPLLADLAAALAADPDPAARTLAARLAPWVTGSHRQLFAGPTITRPQGHLVVFSLRHLPDQVKAAGTLLALDAVWRRVTDPTERRRRLVTVDEAWLLARDPAGARFLHRLAKSARKHWCGLTVVTQDAADLLGSDLGQAVVANAATQVLLGQAPQAIDQLTAAFRLSEGERAFLLAARPGDAILAAGAQRVAFRALASPAEHRLVTTDPEFLASLEREQANSGADSR